MAFVSYHNKEEEKIEDLSNGLWKQVKSETVLHTDEFISEPIEILDYSVIDLLFSSDEIGNVTVEASDDKVKWTKITSSIVGKVNMSLLNKVEVYKIDGAFIRLRYTPDEIWKKGGGHKSYTKYYVSYGLLKANKKDLREARKYDGLRQALPKGIVMIKDWDRMSNTGNRSTV